VFQPFPDFLFLFFKLKKKRGKYFILFKTCEYIERLCARVRFEYEQQQQQQQHHKA